MADTCRAQAGTLVRILFTREVEKQRDKETTKQSILESPAEIEFFPVRPPDFTPRVRREWEQKTSSPNAVL